MVSFSPSFPNYETTFLENEDTDWMSSQSDLDSNTVQDVIVSENNRQRKIWHFLTLGIPAMIEALSIFMEALVQREKVGPPVTVKFNPPNLSLAELGKLSKFHRFDLIGSGSAMNKAEVTKALELANQVMKQIQEAQTNNNTESLPSLLERKKMLIDILEINSVPTKTRSDYNFENWQTRDIINFEMTKDYYHSLPEIFEWFKPSIQSKILKSYSIDYNEAVLAESIALSLAYIEGLDNKTISIPIFDPDTQEYRLALYHIKFMRLGDSLPCYILESEDPHAHPWLTIRGTQYQTKLSPQGQEYRIGSLESMLSDALDHKCITRHVINKSLVCKSSAQQEEGSVQSESLGDLFKRWHLQGKKAILTGHSLGATFVNALTVEFPFSIKNAYGFSGAGVSKNNGKKWQSLLNHPNETVRKECENKLINFDYEGDPIPSGGCHLIGDHFAVTSAAGGSSIYNSHTRSRLNRGFKICRVDLAAENNKFARTFAEKLRIITGYCMRIIFKLLSCLRLVSDQYLPDWWVNRQAYKEYAKSYRTVNAAFHPAILSA